MREAFVGFIFQHLKLFLKYLQNIHIIQKTSQIMHTYTPYSTVATYLCTEFNSGISCVNMTNYSLPENSFNQKLPKYRRNTV